MQKAIIICLKSELSGIDIFIVRHDDPASEKSAIRAKYISLELKIHLDQIGIKSNWFYQAIAMTFDGLPWYIKIPSGRGPPSKAIRPLWKGIS